MMVYHGSNVTVREPSLTAGRKKLDFGEGFYVTTFPKQAEQWAKRKAYENRQNAGLVSVYEYTENEALMVLRFDGYNYDWLIYVANNRRSDLIGNADDYDVVFGGIADDRVIDSINYFIEEIAAGRSSEELVQLTLKQLSYQKSNDQICFKTSKSLQAVVFAKSYEAG
jgi:hypothetical protein